MGFKNILVAAGDRSVVDKIKNCFGRDYRVNHASSLGECLDFFRKKRHEFTFIDIDLLAPGPDGTDNVHEKLMPFWKAFPSAHIIVSAPIERRREAIAAVKEGANDFITYPIDPHEVAHVTERLTETQKFDHELIHLRQSVLKEGLIEGARTNSPVMRDVLEKAESVAPTKTTVLITGETGTGKGVLARIIHSWSNRADGPFISVHCGAIPDTLLESELFGYEKGAFTGAVKRSIGKFQIADGGTLFLDEIGTISPAAQVKMLQVLQDKSVTRIGGEESVKVDLRIVAATNMDLHELASRGLFRQDLYYRLNVFPIEMPALRERPEDIPILVETFLEKLNKSLLRNIRGVDEEVMAVLKRYPWPGNIRELENLVERAYILEKTNILRAESFPGELFSLEAARPATDSRVMPTLDEARRTAVDQVEKRYLREALNINKGRKDLTAAMAGISTRQLHNLMVKYGLRKEEFK